MAPMWAEFWQATISFSTGNLCLRLIVAALATWRLSSLLVNEDGPWLIFWRLRFWLGVGEKVVLSISKRDPSRADGELSVSREGPKTLLSGLLECLWCTSVWVALVMFALALTPLWWLLCPFALSAGAILLDAVMVR